MRAVWLLAGAMLAVAGCSDNSTPTQSSDGITESVATDASAEADKPEGGAGAAKVPITLPKLAYAYKLGFLLPADRLAGTQDQHRALCERMGPARCQLLALERDTGSDTRGEAHTRLRVATNEARAFADSLDQTVTDAGGRAQGTNVVAEDVSKQVVDAEARIRQREMLVERMTAILRSRQGKVEELVEAERSVAQAQEELDQARGWLTELRGRVAMSEFDIRYSAIAAQTSTGSVGNQLGEATTGSASVFLIGLRALLTIAIYLAPWAALLGLAVLAVRGLRRRSRAAPPQQG